MKKKFAKKAAIFLSMVVATTSIVIASTEVHAKDVEPNINSQEFYNYTNTYSYKYNQTSGTEFNYDYRYDLNSKTSAKVDTNEPKITVFTHGWNGDVTNWYGNENTIENESSLVKNLYDTKGGKIYVGSFTLDNPKLQYDKLKNDDEESLDYIFKFYDVTEDFKEDGYIDLQTLNNNKEATITSRDENSIVLFNAACPGWGHEIIYTQFNYMMSNIMYSYRKANGILPKVNLIGHSRGGLTNLQYTLDHPQLVSTLTSFGTPYLGTHLAELDLKYCNNQAFLAVDSIMDKLDSTRTPDKWSYRGERDLANEDAYMTYYNNWNKNYDKYYKSIKASAIGSVTPITYLVDLADSVLGLSASTKKLLKNMVNLVSTGATVAALLNIDYHKKINKNELHSYVDRILKSTDLIKKIESKIDPTLYAEFTFLTHIKSLFYGAIDTIVDSLDFDLKTKTLIFRSDCAVDIESQLASKVINKTMCTFKGFTRTYDIINPGVEFSADNVPHCKAFFQSTLKKQVSF